MASSIAAAVAATAMLAAPAAAPQDARFTVYRDGSPIGTHRIQVVSRRYQAEALTSIDSPLRQDASWQRADSLKWYEYLDAGHGHQVGCGLVWLDDEDSQSWSFQKPFLNRLGFAGANARHRSVPVLTKAFDVVLEV